MTTPKPPAAKPADAPDPGVLVAVSAGVVRIGGRLHRYHAGQTVPADDPVALRRPAAFRPLELSGSGRRGA